MNHRESILALLSQVPENRGLSRDQIYIGLKSDSSAAERAIKHLMDDHLIVKRGDGQGGYVYKLSKGAPVKCPTKS